MFRLFLLASTVALALALAALPIRSSGFQAVAFMVENGSEVDATIRAAMEAERRACRAITADRPSMACEAK